MRLMRSSSLVFKGPDARFGIQLAELALVDVLLNIVLEGTGTRRGEDIRDDGEFGAVPRLLWACDGGDPWKPFW